MKGSADVVTAYFTTKLYQRLSIPVPDMKIIPFYNPEFKFMIHKLDGLTQSNQDENAPYLESAIKAHLNRPFIMV